MITKYTDFIAAKKAQSINERFINLVGDDDRKDQYKDEVYSLLQTTYSKIGGLIANGYDSPDDLIKIPFWKMEKRNGKIISVCFYKDKDGRKSSIGASNGTLTGKMSLINMMIEDIIHGRSWIEISDMPVHLLKKKIGEDYVKYAVPFAIAKDKLNKVGDEIFKPEDDNLMLKNFPELADYLYIRKIGSEYKTKVIFGNINTNRIFY